MNKITQNDPSPSPPHRSGGYQQPALRTKDKKSLHPQYPQYPQYPQGARRIRNAPSSRTAAQGARRIRSAPSSRTAAQGVRRIRNARSSRTAAQPRRCAPRNDMVGSVCGVIGGWRCPMGRGSEWRFRRLRRCRGRCWHRGRREGLGRQRGRSFFLPRDSIR